jgi:hypothetical protein
MGGVSDGIETEDAHGAGLGTQQAEDVFDEGGFAGAIFANEAKDNAARDGERHVVEGVFVRELGG